MQPRAPIERFPDWSIRMHGHLSDLITRAREYGTEFSWNPHAEVATDEVVYLSCVTFTSDVVAVITGTNFYYPMLGTPEELATLGTKPIDIYSQMRKRGYNDLEEGVARIFPKRVPVYAQAGDVVVFDSRINDQSLAALTPISGPLNSETSGPLKALGIVDGPSFMCVDSAGLIQRNPLSLASAIYGVGLPEFPTMESGDLN